MPYIAVTNVKVLQQRKERAETAVQFIPFRKNVEVNFFFKKQRRLSEVLRYLEAEYGKI